MQTMIGAFRVVRPLSADESQGWRWYEVTDSSNSETYTAQVRGATETSPEVSEERLRVLRVLRDLRLPGLVRILDVGCLQSGVHYLVRECHRGKSMVELLGVNAAPLDPGLGRVIARQLAATLSQLHCHGLFGVALCMERIWVTETQQVLLTVCETVHNVGSANCPPIRTVVDVPVQNPTSSVLYMAPEQCGLVEGPALSDRIDVYALGAVLYHALTGRPPFSGQWTRDVLEGHLAKSPRPILRLQPSVPEPLAQLVHRMLAKSPAQRPDIAEVARELARQAGETIPSSTSLPDAMKTMPMSPSSLPVNGGMNRLRPGDQIERFKLVRLLGSGGFADVFEAVDTNLNSGQRVAIKVLLPEYAQNRNLLRRFFDELRATHMVRDPGIVHIYHCQVHSNGLPTITMEYLDGPTLSHELSGNRRLEPARALRIAHQIASTMATAHSHGIIHRDLKPENIILVRDPLLPGGERAKVLDFGLAKIRDAAVGAMRIGTQPGCILGTPRYMAPEQRRDSSMIDDRADVFALGLLLFEMLQGTLPEPSAGPRIPVLRGPYLPFSALPWPLRNVPNAVQELLKNMLAIEPRQRPAMHEVATQLCESLRKGLAASKLPRRIVLAGSLAAIAGGVWAATTSTKEARWLRATISGVKWEITSDQLGAEIRLHDGTLHAYTPWCVAPIPELSNRKFPDPQIVTVYRPGFEERVLCLSIYENAKRHLELKPVSWRVVSEPSGASLIGPGGRELGRTPWTCRSEGRRSDLFIEVRMPGYAPVPLALNAKRCQVHEVRLTAVPGPTAPSTVQPNNRGVPAKQMRPPARAATRIPTKEEDTERPVQTLEI